MRVRRWQKRPERLLKAKFAALSMGIAVPLFLVSRAILDFVRMPALTVTQWWQFVVAFCVFATGVAAFVYVLPASWDSGRARWVRGGWHIVLFLGRTRALALLGLSALTLVVSSWLQELEGVPLGVVVALLLTTLVSAGQFVAQYYQNRHEGAQNAIVKNQRNWLSDVIPPDGYADWRRVESGGNVLLLPPEDFCRALFDQSHRGERQLYAMDPTPYSVKAYAPEMWRLALPCFAKARYKRKQMWNDPKVRLVSSPLLLDDTSQPIRLQETDFFSSVVTNDAMNLTIGQGHEVQEVWQFACPQTQDGAYRIAGPEESILSNQIGISTLAINWNGKLVIVVQGVQSFHSASLLAPSGSGSMDPIDLPDGLSNRDFRLGLVKAMERELVEEIHGSDDGIKRTWVIGCSINLTLGAKPDFYGVSVIRQPPPAVARDEAGLLDGHTLHDLGRNYSEVRANLQRLRASTLSNASVFLTANIDCLLSLRDDQLQTILDTIDKA